MAARKVRVGPHEFKDRMHGDFRRAVIIEGEVIQLSGGRFIVFERKPAPPPAEILDGERDPIRARVVIKEQFKSAGVAMLNMPLPAETRQLRGAVLNWPDMPMPPELRDLDRKTKAAPVRATMRDIGKLNECLEWLLVNLGPEERSVVFCMGMMGYGRRRLARIDPRKRGEMTLQRQFDAGVNNILLKLLAGYEGW